MSKRIVLLIDSDNIFKTEFSDDGLTKLDAEINRLIDLCFSLDEDATELVIRLYGGWRTSNLLTNRASRIQHILSKRPVFPFKHPTRGIVRGRIELAVSLLAAPGLEFETTFKVRNGIRRIRLAESPCFDDCNEPDNTCPVRRFVKFTKSRKKECPADGCTVANDEVFKTAEQKMVDTLLACDLLEAFPHEETAAIGIITEDTDLLPAIIQSRISLKSKGIDKELALILPRETTGFSYPHLADLNSVNISVLNLRGETIVN